MRAVSPPDNSPLKSLIPDNQDAEKMRIMAESRKRLVRLTGL